MISRRDVIKLGLCGGSLAFLSRCLRAPFGSESARQALSPGCALPIPPTLQPYASDDEADYYLITMQTAQVRLFGPDAAATTIWGYNGSWPGPTLRVSTEKAAVVTQINLIAPGVQTTIHNHGHVVSAESDGHPTDLIEYQGSKDYYYPNLPEPAQGGYTGWYHDHKDMLTGLQVYQGLAGAYILSDPAEASLHLPGGDRDIPLILQDRRFIPIKNQLDYFDPNRDDPELGFLGDTPCVNGAIRPCLQVRPIRYRFRLVNGSDTRMYKLMLRNPETRKALGLPFMQIGSDQGLLPCRADRVCVDIAPAERLDFLLDFSGFEGRRIVLNDDRAGGLEEVMSFDVLPEPENDDTHVPSSLREIPRIDPSDPAYTRAGVRTFFLARREIPPHGEVWTIGGRTAPELEPEYRIFDPERADFHPWRGSVEIWEIVNDSSHDHPFHQHLNPFQIIGRGPANQAEPLTCPESWEMGWKDTVSVPAGRRVRIIQAYSSNFLGRYVFHCHKLFHEDHVMMLQQEVVVPGTPEVPGACPYLERTLPDPVDCPLPGGK